MPVPSTPTRGSPAAVCRPQGPLTAFQGAIVVLAIFSLYCIGLEIARMLYTGNSYYDFLIWNLFLAWIPLVLARSLGAARRRHVRPLGLTMLGLGWLLFFPNAPYIVTDFIHLRVSGEAPLWYDVVLIASFATTGLLLAFLSLSYVQQLVAETSGAALGWLVAAVALVLAAFGIFIGRFEVRNSWDVIAQPVPLARDTWHQLTSPAAYPRTLGVTASYAVYLVLAYVALRVVARALPALMDTPSTGPDRRGSASDGELSPLPTGTAGDRNPR